MRQKTHSVSGEEHVRIVHINSRQDAHFCKNEITTAKYSCLSFIPKFLFEQFRKYANIFFLIIALLQQIPGVSPTGKFTTLVPLLIILIVSAVKELIEDMKRHYADRATNFSKTIVLHENELRDIDWKDLQVGDLVKVCNNHYIPADLVILASSEPQGMCYIETSNLDGETNLKMRQSLAVTSNLISSHDLAQYSGLVECELPNRKLDEFVGVLRPTGPTSFPLKPAQLLLRGSKLKNTQWIFGLAVYTGKETKVMLNSTAAPLKQSSVEKKTNSFILFLFGVLLFLTLFTLIANIIWTRKNEANMWYITGEGKVDEVYVINMLLTAFIMFHTIVPISLQVSLEVVRFLQALFINWDKDMYDQDSDTPAMARTSNLNEELGQVRYLFSDKTGTLTRNVMEFKRCSIGGVIYGNATSDSSALNDEALLERLRKKDPLTVHFFIVLTVCHTVVPDTHQDNPNTPIVYQASSPDEAALVKAARALGFIFTTRTPTGVTVNVQGTEISYEVLHVLDFTSARKRMGVVVRDRNGKIQVMVKGADTVIFERLEAGHLYEDVTSDHLRIFASTGLRTLCIASTEIPPERYADWSEYYYKVSTEVKDREENLEKAADAIEQNLDLLGATAIEDKLQDGVPDTIASLLEAGISIWILTGDKQETAVNIGFSCKLLSMDMKLLYLTATSLDETRDQLSQLLKDNSYLPNEVALIVEGPTIEYALHFDCRNLFLDVALSCKSVICCRVSPWQKAELVKLVRQSEKNAISMAVGDGANDVGMIQAAHVGVGISGMEGRQAACASDYAIGQFRFLSKLLLVHGAWNYTRTTKLILYSFYKNVCLYSIQFWFAIYSGYSGQIIFERWTIGMYNVLFTAAAPMALGIFDRSCTSENCLKFPGLYAEMRTSVSFNWKVFLSWMLNSIYHSSLLFWLTLCIFGNENIYSNGQTGSLLVMGNSVYTYVVITVCLKAGIEHTAWTWISHLAIWGSIASWFVFLLVYSHVYPTLDLASDMVGMDTATFGNGLLWVGLLLIPTFCLTRDLAWKMYKRTAGDTLRERVMRLEEQHVDPGPLIRASLRKPYLRLPVKRPGAWFNICSTSTNNQLAPSPTRVDVPRSGYAYSQVEGDIVSQSEMVKTCDSTLPKPPGR